MAYAPSWRVVMNEDVMAKLDVLIGMVRELQADQRSLKESQNSLKESQNSFKESMNSLKESMNVQGERIARMEERLDEQSRILVALIPTQLAAVPRPAA
jgi:peptidoglycan hydrolase CwlO-like protein